MNLIDEYRSLVGAYYGVKSMDDYELKEYVLQDIKVYIEDFISVNPINNFNYKEEANIIEKQTPIITKLQDSLTVLSKMNASLDIILMIRKKIKNLKNNNLL